MGFRLAVAGLCIFASASAAAELTGSFYLEKETFARGEPIFLYLKLMNKGPDMADLTTSDPDQPECSGIDIQVSSDGLSLRACRKITFTISDSAINACAGESSSSIRGFACVA